MLKRATEGKAEGSLFNTLSESTLVNGLEIFYEYGLDLDSMDPEDDPAAKELIAVRGQPNPDQDLARHTVIRVSTLWASGDVVDSLLYSCFSMLGRPCWARARTTGPKPTSPT